MMMMSPGAARRAAEPLMEMIPEFSSARIAYVDQALAVGDVPDVDLLVLADAGDVEQLAVDGARTFVVQLGVRDVRAVDFRLEQGEVHRGLRSVVAFSQQNARPEPGVAEIICFLQRIINYVAVRKRDLMTVSARFQGQKKPSLTERGCNSE